MSSAVAQSIGDDVVRPLNVLVPLIKRELDAGQKAGEEHYRHAGEMLLEAKEQVEPGGWYAWLKRNFTLSESTAKSYMRLARSSSRRRYTTLSEASNYGHRGDGHQTTWHEPVKAIAARVDVERLTRELQARESEAKMVRELGLKLIDIGYKVLAAKLHPDRGGSRDAMTRLNYVRDQLKRAL